MADTKETKEERDVEQRPYLGLGEGDKAYIDPDLSEHVDTGDLPPEEKEWHEARNSAQEEGVEAAEEQEKKVVEQRRKDADEATKEREAEKKAPAKSTPASPSGTATS